MTMRMPFWQRAAIVLLSVAAAAVYAYSYVVSHDLERWLRRAMAGKHVSWPPPRKSNSEGSGDAGLGPIIDTALEVARLSALAAVALGLALLTSRALGRRRRARELATWELRVGRDPLSNPYRVQEAFEGIVGAIGVRWYRRLWAGPDHFALELHRLPDRTTRFTLAAPRQLLPALAGPLEDLYPDVRLIKCDGRPHWSAAITRLKKRRSHVLSLQTNLNYEHAFAEALAAALGQHEGRTTVQLVLTPAPAWVHARARRLLKRRERHLNQGDRRDPLDPGMDSVVEAKELKGALDTQHRSLCYFDLRVAGDEPTAVRRLAGMFAQLRSENELVRRDIRLRRALYGGRAQFALPNPLPGLRTGLISTSELATLWQLPRARAKLTNIPRATMRRAIAPPDIARDPGLELMRDEHGPVGLAPVDRKYGHALIGGQGGGKTSALARHWAIAAADPERAAVLIDGKGPLAEAALGMAPAARTVHYLDLAHPELGFNPLHTGASPGATAAGFVQALIEANPAGAIQAASDSFLRQAIAAVCAVEREPTLWHVYRMLELGGQSDYRAQVVARLEQQPGHDFARSYWRRDFPALIGDKGWAAQALNPPRNKLERLISTRETDLLLRHPVALDLAGVIERGELVVVNAAKAHIGEDNAKLIMQLLLQLLHRQIQAQQSLPEPRRRKLSLLFDEAHNVLTPSVATMLAEGRSAGLEAVFAWQYSAQIANETVRSGVRSLLQSISIFRMREIEDARSLAGLAMDVYSDHISTDQDDQERLRFSADDITRLEHHHAINLWVAQGTPRPGFVAQTQPWEELHQPALAAHHRDAQRARGGHCPAHLPDPVTARAAGAQEHVESPHAEGGQRERRERQRAGPRRAGAASKPSGAATAEAKQLFFESDDLEEVE